MYRSHAKSRLVATPDGGPAFWASIVPYERSGGRGVSERLSALIFEGVDGEWAGSVPVYHNVALESLSDDDLLDLLDQAVSRG